MVAKQSYQDCFGCRPTRGGGGGTMISGCVFVLCVAILDTQLFTVVMRISVLNNFTRISYSGYEDVQ